jgi:flagellar export protein FliJ
MPFRYPLQSVLRLRRSLERQEEQNLYAAAAAVAKLRADIELLERNYLELKNQTIQEMTAGSAGALLQFGAVCQAAFEQAHKSLLSQLAEAEKKRAERLTACLRARQKRETFEGLRDRQEEAYLLEASRHEQQSTDEAFLLRQFSKTNE